MSPQTRTSKQSEEDRRFVQNMREQRDRLNLSQEALAEKVAEGGVPDFNQMALSRIEAGTRHISLAEARAIAEAFETSVEELLRPSREHSLYQQLRTQMDREAHASDQLAAHLSFMQRELELLRYALEDFEESDWQNVLTGPTYEAAERRVNLARMVVEGGLDGAILGARDKIGSPASDAGDQNAPAS